MDKMQMKITNLQGYMLTTPGRMLDFGDKWWPYDANVWICKDINTARQIMAESHIYAALEPNPVWTTIYQVFAPEIDAYKIEGNLIYTRQASRIYAIKPVAHYETPQISMEQYLARAAAMRPHFSRLMRASR